MDGVLPTVLKDSALLNKRIFFIVPHYINNSPEYVECDFKDHWVDSAASVGIVTKHFWGDLISYPGLIPTKPEVGTKELAELRTQITDFKPDVIFFDACFTGNPHTVNPDFLAEVRSITEAKLIGFMADAWGNNWDAIGRYWMSVADVLIHMMPPLGNRPDVLFSSPYPVNPNNFYEIPDSKKDIDLSFFGSSYTWRMPFLQAIIAEAPKLGLKCAIRGHARTNDCPDMAMYAKIVRRSKIVMDFSLRLSGENIITGRAWQALASGCLLLTDSIQPLNHFFTPDKHYLVFKSPEQLCELVREYFSNHAARQKIAQEAVEYQRAKYSSEAIWAGILSRAFQ